MDDGAILREFDARCEERRDALASLLDGRMAKLETQLDHLQQLFDTRLVSAERALSLQAREYERRLTELNHAHARAVTEQDRTLPRERFEVWEKEYVEFRRMVEANHAQAVGAAQAAQAIARGWALGIGLLVSVLSLALHFWR